MKLKHVSNWLRSDAGRALRPGRRRMIVALGAPLVVIMAGCASTNTSAGDVALSAPPSASAVAAAAVLTTNAPPASPSPAAVVAQSADPVVTTHAAAPPVAHTTHAPPPVVHTTQAAPAKPSTCGAPSNPYGYNFCGRGGYVTSPPAEVCSYFDCIANFFNGHGYMVECNDGTYSMSGGIRGACSHHGGEDRAVDGG